jgi:hypothetical protein
LTSVLAGWDRTIGAGGFEGTNDDDDDEAEEAVVGVLNEVVIVEKVVENLGALGGSMLVMNLEVGEGETDVVESWKGETENPAEERGVGEVVVETRGDLALLGEDVRGDGLSL